MKELRETKLVEQTTVTFIANDGKVFSGEYAEEDCKRYERLLDFKKLEKDFKKLHPIDLNFPLVDYCCCEACTYMVTLKSEEDLQTLIDYHEGLNRFADSSDLSYKKDEMVYPCTKIVFSTDGWVEFINQDFADLCEDLKKLVRQIEPKIKKDLTNE